MHKAIETLEHEPDHVKFFDKLRRRTCWDRPGGQGRHATMVAFCGTPQEKCGGFLKLFLHGYRVEFGMEQQAGEGARSSGRGQSFKGFCRRFLLQNEFSILT